MFIFARTRGSMGPIFGGSLLIYCNFPLCVDVFLPTPCTHLTLNLLLYTTNVPGCVSEGSYRTNAFRTWRRWYLGRLHTLVHTYFIVFNRWAERIVSGSLGMGMGMTRDDRRSKAFGRVSCRFR